MKKKQKNTDLERIDRFVSEEVILECPMTNEEVIAKIDFSRRTKPIAKKKIMRIILFNLAYITILCLCVLVTIIITRKHLISDWGIDEGKIEELFGSTVAILPLEEDSIEIFYIENEDNLDYYVKVIFNNKKSKVTIISNDEEYRIVYNKESIKLYAFEENDINTIEFDIVYQNKVKHFLLQN